MDPNYRPQRTKEKKNQSTTHTTTRPNKKKYPSSSSNCAAISVTQWNSSETAITKQRPSAHKHFWLLTNVAERLNKGDVSTRSRRNSLNSEHSQLEEGVGVTLTSLADAKSIREANSTTSAVTQTSKISIEPKTVEPKSINVAHKAK